jgi:hypothetical protein
LKRRWCLLFPWYKLMLSSSKITGLDTGAHSSIYQILKLAQPLVQVRHAIIKIWKHYQYGQANVKKFSTPPQVL